MYCLHWWVYEIDNGVSLLVCINGGNHCSFLCHSFWILSRLIQWNGAGTWSRGGGWLPERCCTSWRKLAIQCCGYTRHCKWVHSNCFCLVWHSVLWPITGEGASFDYTVNTNLVRALFRRPDPPDNVVFTFRVDAIAQEPNETLTLELVPTATTTMPTGDAVFFRNTLNMNIIDSDSKILLNKLPHLLIH